MNIRRFKPSDAKQVAQLFHDTVRTVNREDYSREQVEAWAPDDINFRDWVVQCSQKYTIVAEQNQVILGFGELESDGHIDCFYIHRDYQRRGVGRTLYQALETRAREWHVPSLKVEASITALSFFREMGFSIIKKQRVLTRGVTLTNFKMRKQLGRKSY
ncbi:GNAT family N-acetyltransferase [Aliifodinibius sp. S!AR15-10]|uniref:GNAT family N-acetyltransferase n=1 Tax=Aliifodinibius sp. S!AR15-10 TaxID=2950437 RepID=UPI0028572CBB|nr:GNAT family N-acetyltransferase [Aliifodinibius sp. S!AR15-10]MDR8390341.1 GNAT family N-acetyltransferase [Aliifodinibius sp. S!AR15-10]